MIKTREEFLKFLHGLNLPVYSTVKELIESNGEKPSDYYSWQRIVEFPEFRPPIPGFVDTIHTGLFKVSDLLPPLIYSAFVQVDLNACENHSKVLGHLCKIFGPARELSTSNVKYHEWRFGSAAVRIMTWPPDLNIELNRTNTAHQKHPEMLAYTHLDFSIGTNLSPSSDERILFQKFKKLGKMREFNNDYIDNLVTWSGASTSIMRDYTSTLPSVLGFSDNQRFLVGTNKLVGILIPNDAILEIELIKLLPARGPGGAKFSVKYIDQKSSTQLQRSIELLSESKLKSVKAIAESIAIWANKPLQFHEYLND